MSKRCQSFMGVLFGFIVSTSFYASRFYYPTMASREVRPRASAVTRENSQRRGLPHLSRARIQSVQGYARVHLAEAGQGSRAKRPKQLGIIDSYLRYPLRRSAKRESFWPLSPALYVPSPFSRSYFSPQVGQTAASSINIYSPSFQLVVLFAEANRAGGLR